MKLPPKVLVRSFRKPPLLLAKLARKLPFGVLVTLAEKKQPWALVKLTGECSLVGARTNKYTEKMKRNPFLLQCPFQLFLPARLTLCQLAKEKCLQVLTPVARSQGKEGWIGNREAVSHN